MTLTSSESEIVYLFMNEMYEYWNISMTPSEETVFTKLRNQFGKERNDEECIGSGCVARG
jgi:hypothetical protein